MTTVYSLIFNSAYAVRTHIIMKQIFSFKGIKFEGARMKHP